MLRPPHCHLAGIASYHCPIAWQAHLKQDPMDISCPLYKHCISRQTPPKASLLPFSLLKSSSLSFLAQTSRIKISWYLCQTWAQKYHSSFSFYLLSIVLLKINKILLKIILLFFHFIFISFKFLYRKIKEKYII